MKKHRVDVDETKKKSAAYVLVEHVWEKSRFRSWIRLNYTMQAAVALAIKSGMDFDLNDISSIYHRMRGGFWFGDGIGEWMHGLAVEYDNTSAAVSFEAWTQRKPFILESKRLHVGARVDVKHLGKNVKCRFGMVTSFTSSDEVIICTYGGQHPPHHRLGEVHSRPSGKPVRRFTLTHAEVRSLEKARVKAIKDAKKKPIEEAA